jgi:hypothetical protein
LKQDTGLTTGNAIFTVLSISNKITVGGNAVVKIFVLRVMRACIPVGEHQCLKHIASSFRI